MLEQAQRDYLTGFFLRESLNFLLKELINDARPRQAHFSITLIDVDHFKKFNDKYGHLVGDEILKYATGTMRMTFNGRQCYFFRYGGDEFIVIFPDKDIKEAYHMLQQYNYNIAKRPFLFKNKFFRITVSVGIAGFPHDGETTEDLIHKADLAMYFSKRHGRNRTTIASKMRFIQLRNTFVLLGSLFVTFWSLYALYQYAFRDDISHSLNQIKNIRVMTAPRGIDVIILKNGASFEGRLISETLDEVKLRVELDQGEGTLTFSKSEISKIKYASENSP